MQFTTFTPPTTRKYISKTIEEVLKGYHNDKSSFSIDIPPRSGKANIIYAAAYELVETGVAPFSMAISPWLFLKDQIKSNDKIQSHINLYKVKGRNMRVGAIDDFTNQFFWDIKDKYHIWSTSLGVCYSQTSKLVAAIEIAIERGYGRPIIFFDEAHILGGSKEMGRVFDDVQRAGAYVVSLTGTFYRSDGETIRGGNVTDVEEKDVKITTTRRIDENTVIHQTRSGSKKTMRCVADKTIPWRKAWDVGALCHVDVEWVGADHTIEGKETKKISEYNNGELPPGALRDVLESPVVVEKFTEVVVREVAAFKKQNVNAAGMIVVGGDITDEKGQKEVDRHATQVKNSLVKTSRDAGHAWDITVITMNDAGDKGSKKLDAFRDDGVYDIIVVKMMGLVGLDVPRLKVLGLMSSLRNGPMLGQALSRPLTVWPGIEEKRGRVILLDDKKMQDAYEDLVTSQGGQFSKTTTVVDEEHEEESKKAPKKNGTTDNAYTSGHTNDMLMDIQGDHADYCNRVRKVRPGVTRGKTDSEIIKMMRSGEVKPLTKDEKKPDCLDEKSPLAGVDDVDEALDQARELFSQHSKDFANYHWSYASEQGQWSHCRVEIQRQARIKAGITVPLAKEKDISRIKAANAYMQLQIRESHNV